MANAPQWWNRSRVVLLRLWQTASHASTLQSVFQWTGLGKPALSASLAVLTLILGIGHLPASYIITAAVVVFAGCVHVIEKIDGWRLRRDLRHRFTFRNPIFHWNINLENPQRSLVQIGGEFENTSPSIPIFFRFDLITASINNRTNTMCGRPLGFKAVLQEAC
jgi:hypothetical protein